MAYIRLPDDSSNVGKKVETTEVTVGADLIEREHVRLAGAGANDVAEIKNATPAGTEYGVITRDATGPLGSATETAPATDTASSGLNGRLQRVAQRLTSLIALIPGALTGSGNFKVAIVEDTVGGLVVTDGATVNAGQSNVPVVESSPFTFDGSNYKRGGWTPYKLNSAASTNATSLKGSAGSLGWIVVTNINAAVRYLKFYNKASAPTVGTDTPVLVFAIPGAATGGGVSLNMGRNGVAFSTGIAFAITTGAADSDTGAVAANEQIVNCGYL